MNVKRFKAMYKILDAYNVKRVNMLSVTNKLGYKRYRRCNRLLTNLSKEFSIDYNTFKDIVRVYQSSELNNNELVIYYNYSIINRIILTH
jgi:hypothetical protein